MKPYDAAIVGGGVAGPAVAAKLARAGRSVVLFEKEKGSHDKVCGEFISHEGARYLADLGVNVAALGGVFIDRVRPRGAARRSRRGCPFRLKASRGARSMKRCCSSPLKRGRKFGADAASGAWRSAKAAGPCASTMARRLLQRMRFSPAASTILRT